jgi:hypothetical protein
MKNISPYRLPVLFILVLITGGWIPALAREVLVEAESFRDRLSVIAGKNKQAKNKKDLK